MVADSDDAWLILSELRTLIHEHVQRVRTVAAGKLSGKREFFERRSNDNPPKHPPSDTSACVPADSTPLREQVSVHGGTDQRASETDFDGLGSIEAKAQT
jgi:hypothetical protein